MSYSHNAKLIYGFHAPNPVPLAVAYSAEDLASSGKLKPVYLEEWLRKMRFRNVDQINAGESNGGSPDFFVGVELVAVDDYTRSEPFEHVDLLAVREVAAAVFDELQRAQKHLAPNEKIGYWLIGEVS